VVSEVVKTKGELENEIFQLRQENHALKVANEDLRAKLEALLRRIYGRRSEKLDPNQVLFDFMELGEEASKEIEAEESSATTSEDEEVETVVRKKKGRRRNPIPPELPRRREVIEPSAEERICTSCNFEKTPIGKKVTEELEFIPAQVFVREIVRVSYACPKCHEGVVTPPLPPRPIEKGRPGPGLLSHIAVSKYADHLPLYRQEKIFERAGLELSRQTLCHWLGEIAGLLEPLVDAMKAEILRSPLVQADETPVQVMDPSFPGRTRRGYLWAYTVPWAEVVFDFTSTRRKEGPTSFLKTYRGFLQADGYSGYDEVFRSGRIAHVGCWAHARRGFYAAKGEAPKETLVLLGAIQKLYRLEREAKEAGLSSERRVELRRREARPILDVILLLIQDLSRKALPQSKLGKAIQYTLGEWSALERYVEVGEAEIDNNSVEHAIRSVALGRKNWLFLGDPAGGGLRAEVLYSLIGTCKRLQVNPFEYLRDVIDRVSTHPHSRIAELLPRNWSRSRGCSTDSVPVEQLND
jgi:transposase